jgi:cytochrome c553
MPHVDLTLRMLRRAMLLLSAWLPLTTMAVDLTSQGATLTADVPHGGVLFIKHCASCHGRQAWGNGLREIPALAGQRRAYLIAQLSHFAAGQRQGSELHGPVMHEALQPPDVDRAQALLDLAAWLSQSGPNHEPEHGQGQALAAGTRVYASACADCHGERGEGRESPPVPALASQHYSYLLARIRGFTSGHAAHAPGIGPWIVGTAAQQQALADYASRLTLPDTQTD